MSRSHRPNAAYIVSMRHGLDAWTYKELDALASDLSCHLFPIIYGTGPYMPEAEWGCYRFARWQIAWSQVRGLFTQPVTYLKLLAEALLTRTVPDMLLAFNFAQEMSRRRIDLIHCVYGDHKFFIGYYCKKLLNVPLSVALYGYDLRANPNWRMFRRAIQSADQIVVNCDYNRRLLLDRVPGDDIARKTHVIRHYAVVPERAIRQDAVKLLIVGGFSERKGHAVLFRALQTLGDAANGIEVWVVGYRGPVDVAQLARDFQVADKVVVFGSMSDQGLDYLFRRCDIFCLPSQTDRHGVSEGLPVALIEAMAYGKPVIASRITGIPELVEDILIEEKDSDALAAAIKRLKDDPALRQRLGARNQEIVRERYSKQNVIKMRDLLRAAARQQPATPDQQRGELPDRVASQGETQL